MIANLIKDAQRIGRENQAIKKEFVDCVFCLPGSGPSSYKQGMGVNLAMINMMKAGMKVNMRSAMGSEVYAVRNGCMRDSGFQITQKPFEKTMDYKHMIWIDSDNIVNYQQIMDLIKLDVDIVGAWCRQSPGSNKINCGYVTMNPTIYKTDSLTEEYMATKTENLLEVDYVGFGLIVIKKGVFEALQYPWFKQWPVRWIDSLGQECEDMITDDLGFCLRAKKAGFKIHVAPGVRIGHEKTSVV